MTPDLPAVPVTSIGPLTKEIANAVVRSHKRFFGRGPTRAQAFFRHNIIVVIMEASLTEAERHLAGQGDSGHDAVLEMRLRYEETMRGDLVDAVEALTGCQVEAFMTCHHIEPDLAAELFVLDRPVASERIPPLSDR